MDDLISRKDAIDVVETIGFDFSDSDLSAVELEEVCEAIGEVRQEWLQRIKRLPSAQPQRTGRWILTDNESFKQCSECGRHVYAYKHPNKAYPYCHCGAKMEDEGW